MSQTAAPAPVPEAARSPAPPARETARRQLGVAADIAIRSLGPVVLALVAAGLLLLCLGVNPLAFYRDILSGGIQLGAWQDTVMRMAPLLLIALGLIVVFRAGIWNLGIDGQFLLAAAIVAGVGPELAPHVPKAVLLVTLFVLAAAVGASWTIIPAFLRAKYSINEIITTLMMSFIGINLANILIKGPFQDFSSNVPQTKVLGFEDFLPTIPTTRIHVGVLVAGAGAVVIWYLMGRTSFGLRLHILGADVRPRATPASTSRG